MTAGPQASDAELVRRSLGGDDAAFASLVRQHQQGLHAFILRYTGNAADAAELAQESFLAAWKALSRYDAGRPFGIWLRAIALNKCRDQARRAKVRQMLTGDAGIHAVQIEKVTDSSIGAEDSLLHEERLRALERAVAALPPALKEPLLLTRFEDITHEEAARILKISPKAVEMRVYRARRALAEMLERG